MMKMPIVFFFVAVVLASAMNISAQGSGGCKLSDIVISQTKTGSIVQGNQEYLVTVSNKCHCSQSEVLLNCDGGLSSVEPVDPHVIHPVNDAHCILLDGKALAGAGAGISFKYAWTAPQDLSVFSSRIDC